MRWPTFEHVFFDCDSTLTAIEGIDILAEMAGKKEEIVELTRMAMDGEIGLEEVYAKRLSMINPTYQQVRAIGQAYWEHVVEDASAVIAALRQVGVKVYIISGGLYEPVFEFGIALGVDPKNIRAVQLRYDQLSGRWWSPRETEVDPNYLTFVPCPLTTSEGKSQIVRELLGGQGGRSLLVGDGSSDYAASSAVDLFVGYGGVEKRASVLAKAPVYLHTASLAPLMALACSPSKLSHLETTSYGALMNKAKKLIRQGAVTFNDERLNQKFLQAYQAIYSGPC